MVHYPPIIVQQNFKVSCSRLWLAISEAEEMRQWYFPMIPEFRTELGFSTRFTVEVEDRVFPHLWQVTQVKPEQLLAYNWQFEGYPGKGSSSFQIDPDKDGCTLTLRFEVSEPFPDDIPEFKRESGVQGWNYLIGESLVAYLKN